MAKASTALLLSAAVTLACEVGETDDAPDLDTSPRAAPSDYDDCRDDRYIVTLASPAQPCGNVEGWVGRRLFGRGTEWLEANPGPVPTAMRKFCFYDWNGPPAQDPDPEELLNQFGENAIQDCAFVSPQSASVTDVITDALSPKLEAMFLAASHHVPAADLAATQGSRQPVFVAALDTQPNHNPPNPRSEHGESVARIVRKFACPGGDEGCPVQVESVLALPRIRDGHDPDRGGYRGSQATLAAAMHEAVRRWQLANLGKAKPSPLVIVQALGWEPGDPMVDQGPGNDAMQIAMREVACYGGIVIAAAGNDTTNCNAGPSHPGGVEAHALPTAAACATLGIIGPPDPETDYAPILHSVGGLDLRGAKLKSARDGGFPRLAGPASHVVIDTDSGDPTMMMTGTSVPTAAASGIAALVWSYAPGLTGAEVMQAIYDAGDGLEGDLPADYGLSGEPRPEIHKAYACDSLVQACSVLGACVEDPRLTCDGYPEPDIKALKSIVQSLPVGHRADPRFERYDEMCEAYCESEDRPLYVSEEGTDATCEDHRADAYDLAVRPKPDLQICYSCTHTVESQEVAGALSEKFEGRTIDDVIIDTYYLDETSDSHAFGAVTMTPNEVTVFELEGARTDIGVEKSMITIKLSDGTVSTEPMLAAQ